MIELILLAQAALNLYSWEPAQGPVHGYHVYVNRSLHTTVYEEQAWLDLEPGDLVEVQAVDSLYRTGPFSEASEPHQTVASCVLRESPACLADINQDGVVGGFDLLSVQSSYGQRCSCAGDMDGDLIIGSRDISTVFGLIGQECR